MNESEQCTKRHDEIRKALMYLLTDGENIMYVFTCIRCGKERMVVGKKGICSCGLQYELEWPSKDIPAKKEKELEKDVS